MSLLLGACTPATQVPPAPSAHQLAPAPLPVASSPPPAPLPRDASVRAHGCNYGGPSTDRFGLWFDVDETDGLFAYVKTRHAVHVTFADRPKLPTSVRLQMFALAFDVQIPEDGIPLHANGRLHLGGVYDPSPEVPLHWRARDDGQPGLLLSVARDEPRLSRSDAVACGTFSLHLGSGFAPLHPRPTLDARAVRPLALAARPGGEVAAVAERKGREVAVLSIAGQHSEIWFDDQGEWRGWVSSSSLARLPSPNASFLDRVARAGPQPRERFPGLTCPRDMPLWLARGARIVARVGTLRARTHVALEAASAAPFRVLSANQKAAAGDADELTLVDGYQLVIDQADSSACVDADRDSPE